MNCVKPSLEPTPWNKNVGPVIEGRFGDFGYLEGRSNQFEWEINQYQKISIKMIGAEPNRATTPPKLKPRWDVHSRGNEDWLSCAREALSSVLGE